MAARHEIAAAGDQDGVGEELNDPETAAQHDVEAARDREGAGEDAAGREQEDEGDASPSRKRRRTANGYIIFLNSNCKRIMSELSANSKTKVTFHEMARTAAAQWKALPEAERALYHHSASKAAAVAEAASEKLVGSKGPVAKASVGGAAGKGCASGGGNGKLRKMAVKKPQLLSRGSLRSLMASVQSEVQAEWEGLPKRGSSAQLLAWRYEDPALRCSREKERRARLHSALDDFIAGGSQDSAPAPQRPRRTRQLGLGVARVGSGKSSAATALERLGIASVKVPHPSLLLLERDPELAAALAAETAEVELARRGSAWAGVPGGEGVASVALGGKGPAEEAAVDASGGKGESGTGKKGKQLVSRVEAAAATALHRYVSLDAVERAALWAVVGHRARQQELTVLRVLHGRGVALSPAAGQRGPNGFEAFRIARLHGLAPFRWPSAQQLAACHCASPWEERAQEDDSAWELDVEAEFLQLSPSEKSWWIDRADAWSHMVPKRSNWMPCGEELLDPSFAAEVVESSQELEQSAEVAAPRSSEAGGP